MRVRSPRDVGLLLRGRRKDLGWSQERLAREARVSRWWISAVESGRTRAELDLVLRTVEALGLVLDLRPEEPTPGSDAKPVCRIDLDDLLTQYGEARL